MPLYPHDLYFLLVLLLNGRHVLLHCERDPVLPVQLFCAPEQPGIYLISFTQVGLILILEGGNDEEEEEVMAQEQPQKGSKKHHKPTADLELTRLCQWPELHEGRRAYCS